MEEAERLCDRIVIVDHGKVIAADTCEALLKLAPASQPVRVVGPTLESVFLHLTGRQPRD
jgi:ABC-2 type transport system ATP-binding protein